MSCASAGTARQQLGLRPVVTGLNSPVYVASVPGQPSKLYVVEQSGTIRVLVSGKLRAAPFLDVRKKISFGGEQGLLSVAFHPNYTSNHKFYVDYTDTNGDTRVVEYRSDGNVAIAPRAAAAVRQAAVREPQRRPAAVRSRRLAVRGHGRRRLGRRSAEPRAESDQRLGKLLRIDVNSRKPIIQIAGLRAPQPVAVLVRQPTGDLYIGDVGQNAGRRSTTRRRAHLEWRTTAGTSMKACTRTPATR